MSCSIRYLGVRIPFFATSVTTYRGYARLIGACLLVAISLTLFSCAPQANISAQFAPRVLPPDLQVQRIAVLPFQGRQGFEVARELESDLVNHQFDGKPYFTVVDRDRTRQLMSEFARGLRGEIDPRTAARFGRQIGAQAILFGAVTADGIQVSYHPGTAIRCVAQNQFGFCTKSMLVHTTCIKRQARFSVVARLVNVESSQVVYEKEHTAGAISDSCSGRTATNSGLLSAARNLALQDVVPDIAPYNANIRANLKIDSGNLSGAYQSEFQHAVEFAQAGRMDRACQMWRDINNKDSDRNISVIYDYAICAETSGKLSEALDLLKSADNMSSQPDSDIDNSLTRVRTEIAERHRLAAAQ